MLPAGISMKNNVILILLSLSLAVFGVITTEVAVIGLLPAATDGTVADHGTAGRVSGQYLFCGGRHYRACHHADAGAL